VGEGLRGGEVLTTAKNVVLALIVTGFVYKFPLIDIGKSNQ
jgi:hypothetical protein